METKNELLKAAYATRERKEAEAKTRGLEDRQIESAFEELEHRTLLVSFPDYSGPDSHAKIRADKEALQEFLADNSGKEWPAEILERDRQDNPKSSEELLTEIRDSLDSSSGKSAATSSTDLTTRNHRRVAQSEKIDLPFTPTTAYRVARGS